MAESLYPDQASAQRDVIAAEREMAKPKPDALVIMRGQRANQWLLNRGTVYNSKFAPELIAPAHQKSDYDDPEPQYGAAPDDLSLDRGRMPLNDPRMVRAEERDRALAEGRSLAASDIQGVKRRGTLRRAREKPLGLYDLLTRDGGDNYYEGRRQEMMEVPLEGGDTATRIRPGSDTAYSPSTGKWVDTTPRRVPEKIRRRRAQQARDRSKRDFIFGSTPTSTAETLEGDISPEDAGARRAVAYKRTGNIRRDRKARLFASRQALEAKRKKQGGEQGEGYFEGVPGIKMPRSAWENLTPQQQRQMNSRALNGDPQALAFIRQISEMDTANRRTAIESYGKQAGAAKAIAGTGEEVGRSISEEDWKAFGGITGRDPAKGLGLDYREAANMWNTASAEDQKNILAFQSYAEKVQPGKWLGQRGDVLRKLWLMRYRFKAKKAITGPGGEALEIAEEFPHDPEGGFLGFGSSSVPDRFERLRPQPGAQSAQQPGVPGTTQPGSPAPTPWWKTEAGRQYRQQGTTYHDPSGKDTGMNLTQLISARGGYPKLSAHERKWADPQLDPTSGP